jgi:hypothetical protein
VGQLYDPFYDLPAGYNYDEHPSVASRLMACWLRSTNTSVLVVPQSNTNYMTFVNEHGDWFDQVGQFSERGWLVEAVASPRALDSACR